MYTFLSTYVYFLYLRKGTIFYMEQNIQSFIQFLKESPTAFHAVGSVKVILEKNGFTEYEDDRCIQNEQFRNQKGNGIFFTRNDSSLVAIRFPKKQPKGFRIVASHSDSPCFKVKTKPEIRVEDSYVKLNVEKYGGMILSSWLDRVLGIAGRVITKDEYSGQFISHLVDIKRCAIIPNVAIHFNREINKGFEYNPQVDMLPLFSGNKEKTVKQMIAEALAMEQEAILGEDLYLYVDQEPVLVGAEEEFIVSPRLDDLECAYGSLMGFLEGEPQEYISVYCLFDNEEVGSRTRQGADSDFIEAILKAIWEITAGNSFTVDGVEKTHGLSFASALRNSFLLSADNAHALHPNHPEKSDVTNKPYINGGIVLKFNGNAHYTTDGYSQAFVTDLCKLANVPMQTFANRSDIQGGSTLGNIMMSHLSIPAADIGLGQLAMHSAVETAGVKDIEDLITLMKMFFMS